VGEPLVLLPGMGCTDALWSRLGLPTGVEVRSCLLTEPSLDAQVDRLLDELPRRFALAGLSLGGIVAMAVVRRAPERVTRLALMSTTPRGPTAAQHQGWRRLQGLLRSTSAREVQCSMLPSLISPAVIAARPDLVELTLAMADEVGERAFDRQLRLQATRVDERPGLRDVRCPTLVLAAADDALCDVGKHQEIADLVSGSRLVTISDCAHLSPLEQPEMVSVQLARWLGATSTPGV
jgi:pimeloyl-ACP methyl ester carboxylesterase